MATVGNDNVDGRRVERHAETATGAMTLISGGNPKAIYQWWQPAMTTCRAMQGPDTINAGPGMTRLSGGEGPDKLAGNKGDDLIDGECPGNDDCFGGNGL